MNNRLRMLLVVALAALASNTYRRDLPDAGVHLLDTGHFALETHSEVIADHIRDFLGRRNGSENDSSRLV